MNRIRQIAVTLIALGLVTAAVYSTGAFDSFTTQRNANVQVVGDAAGYLALQPAEGPNGAYATYERGELALRLDGSIEGGPAGAGVNPGGKTTIDDVVTITNRGVQSVAVWLTNENEAIELQHDGDSFESAQRAVTLDPGDSIPIGIEIDTTVTDDPSLESDFTIHVEEDGESINKDANTDTAESEIRYNESDQTENKNGNTSDESKNDDKNATGPKWTKSKDEAQKLPAEDKIAAFITGGVTGSLGDQGGIADWLVPDKLDSSPFYIFGNVVLSFVPGLDTWNDITALAHSIFTKNAEGIVINGIAAIPGLGNVADTGQIFRTVSKWTKKFPHGAKKAAKLLSKHLLGHLPEEISSRILNKFTDTRVQSLTDNGFTAKNIVDIKAKGHDLRKIKDLRRRGIPASQINKYIEDGYSPRQIAILTDSGLKPNDLERITDRGYSFGWVYKKLHRGNGIPMADVSHYLDEGVDLKRIEQLRDKRIPASDIRHYVDQGTNLHRIADLRNQNIPAKAIRRYLDTGVNPDRIIRLRKQDVSPKTIETLVNNGKNLETASKLRYLDIPNSDIQYYAKYDVNFRWITEFKKYLGWSADTIRTALSTSRGAHIAAIPTSKYRDIRNWCTSNPDKKNKASICQIPGGVGSG